MTVHSLAADLEVVVSETYTARFDGGASGLNPGVKTIDDAGDVIVPRATGFVEDVDAPGLYIKTNVIAPDTTGTYVLVFDTGEPTPDYAYLELAVRAGPTVLTVAPGFPTMADILAASEVTELTTANTTMQEIWYTVYRKLIERYCNQVFALDEDLTLYVDGVGGRRVSLPRRLATLAQVSGTGTSLDASDFLLSPAHDTLTIGSLTGSTWVERALLDGPKSLPSGVGSIAVTGDWGWTEEELQAVPLLIAMMKYMESQALVAAHGLIGSVRAAGRMGAPSIGEGPLRVDLNLPDVVLEPEVMSLLEDYVWQPAPVVA